MIDRRNSNADLSPPDRRAYRPAWIGFSIFCGLFLIAAIALMAIYGVPGTTGGTSPNQQQTSGAPQPTNDINTGATRSETTGYGKGNQGQPAR